MPPDPARHDGLLALFARFLRFGLLAWGGPVAQIAMLKRELVEEKRWLDPTRFNRLLAIYQVLPGPEAHEMCVHLGMMRHGRVGGVLAGLGFMLPGFVLMVALAWLYGRLDLSSQPLAAILMGAKIGVIALIIRAVHRIGDHSLGDRWLWAFAVASAAASIAGVSFWIVLPAAGIAYALLEKRRPSLAIFVLVGAALAWGATARWGGQPESVGSATAVAAPWTIAWVPLFLSGLKAGLLTFGGAYTAIPFVRNDAVGRGWVSDSTFLDGLALSQIIPAPLIIFATFVGYRAGGMDGALAMTAGMFFPAFAFTLLFFDQLERVMEDSRIHRFLEGVAAAVVGMIAATTLQLAWGVAELVPEPGLASLIFGIALVLVYRWKSKLAVPTVVLMSALGGMVAFAPA